MRENFPTNKVKNGPFDTGSIGAGHINTLSKSQGRDGRPFRGPFVSQFDNSFGLQPPFQQRIFVVTHVVSDDEYEIQPRFFDPDAAAWDTDAIPGPYILDTSEFDLALNAGDIIAAWFHPQRDAYVPVSGAGDKGYVILFEIAAGLPDIGGLRAVSAVPLYKICGGRAVPAIFGGKVTVLDPMLCIFSEDDSDLVDRRGIAERMERIFDADELLSSGSSSSDSIESGESSSSSPSSSSSSSFSSGSQSGESSVSSTSSEGDDDPCVWVVTSLCCP